MAALFKIKSSENVRSGGGTDGLGQTKVTIDKLKSIPRFKIELSFAEFHDYY
ncbi:hypothetical protein [Spiroplasma endosymbiont of Polydrusus formosus]|uniref:hypothetical protein n=1 Tax=Spiroplasma endosymbiont of Polydrusus formosus TaxID=3139326 RepID=UPI0035B55514